MTRVPGDLTSSSPQRAAMERESFPPSMPTPQSSSAWARKATGGQRDTHSHVTVYQNVFRFLALGSQYKMHSVTPPLEKTQTVKVSIKQNTTKLQQTLNKKTFTASTPKKAEHDKKHSRPSKKYIASCTITSEPIKHKPIYPISDGNVGTVRILIALNNGAHMSAQSCINSPP